MFYLINLIYQNKVLICPISLSRQLACTVNCRAEFTVPTTPATVHSRTLLSVQRERSPYSKLSYPRP